VSATLCTGFTDVGESSTSCVNVGWMSRCSVRNSVSYAGQPDIVLRGSRSNQQAFVANTVNKLCPARASNSSPLESSTKTVARVRPQPRLVFTPGTRVARVGIAIPYLRLPDRLALGVPIAQLF